MDIKWDLNSIYTSLQSDKLKSDILMLEEKVKAINLYAENNFTAENSGIERAVKGYIDLVNDVLLLNKISAYLNFILTTDTENTAAAKLYDRVCGIKAELAAADSLFKAYIKNIDIDCINAGEHRYFLERAKADASHTLGAEAEKVIAKFKSTGSGSWEKLWESITSSLMCEYRSAELSLSEIRGLAYSADKSVRFDAYKGELKAYKKIEFVGAACLNGIKGEVIAETEMRGYRSALERSALNSAIDMEILNAMIGAIDDNIEELNKFYVKKAKMLGHKGLLPFYDLFAPVGESELQFTFDEAREFIEGAYGSFSTEMKNHAIRAFENRWIDASPRRGKVGGAYCEYIKDIEESRILMNFSGNFEDIITLAHELGHGYHNRILKTQTPINSDYPMPLAETASTIGENIAFKYAESVLPKDALVTVRESRLSGELQSICDIYSRYLFEDSFFNERTAGSLSADEICGLMINAQKKAYSGGLDPNVLHPYMWLCKPHYYDADFNYYNYPYAFGDLFARSLFAMYEEQGDRFIPKYDELLSCCGKMSVRDVGKIAGIDFADKNFWKMGINKVIEDIKKL